MLKPAPHVIPYQGSKRKLSSEILKFFPPGIQCLYEPFAGSAAISLAAAANKLALSYCISDKLEPLSELWRSIISAPESIAEEYQHYWEEQLSNPCEYYYKIRDDFNYQKRPAQLLYLIARCVKNSIRFNGSGQFNQGPDKRRLGMRPLKLKREIIHAAHLLRGKSEVMSCDFSLALKSATNKDLVYLDPPWQGTSGKKDPRYAFLLDYEGLMAELDRLNRRKVPFILSFDGICGTKEYGESLPASLSLKHVLLNAGRSTQATLLGKSDITYESLYLSPALIERLRTVNIDGNAPCATRSHAQEQLSLLAS
jgi:DNA adenine methylase